MRPDGLLGDLVLRGAARDLLTPTRGEPQIIDRCQLDARVDYAGQRQVVEITARPADPRLAGLAGLRAGPGFRRALGEQLPDLHRSGAALYLLLDDLPVATMISGGVLERHRVELPRTGAHRLPPVDVCAGWAAGGLMLTVLEETGSPGLVGDGPPAPSLTTDDPLAWHELATLPVTATRRRRRIDVSVDASGTTIEIDAMFRDSYMEPGPMEPSAIETVVHEYSLTAVADRHDGVVLAASAVPRVLPGPECPAAATSVARLVGQPLAGLRSFVLSELTGPTTCTHLNDALRAMADVPSLIERLASV